MTTTVHVVAHNNPAIVTVITEEKDTDYLLMDGAMKGFTVTDSQSVIVRELKVERVPSPPQVGQPLQDNVNE